MNSSQYKTNELKKFCATINFKPSEIDEVSNNLKNYYKCWSEDKLDKQTNLPKTYKDGTIKKRVLTPSIDKLSLIQKSISKNILAKIAIPENIHGGIKKKSNVTNAKPHQGNKYQFTTDLQDFFPNISSKLVYKTLIELGLSPIYSRLITKLTTWQYGLPQGAPTSTHLANLAFVKTDLLLIELCKNNNLTYTRFVDDLTFSSPQDFQPILNDILDIITDNGFKISYRKTQYKGNQKITGINTYLNKIDAPVKIIEKSKIELETKAKIKPNFNYLSYIRNTNKTKFLKKSKGA